MAIANRFVTGQQIRDWLYVDDHCAASWRAISVGEPGRTYNVGENNEMPNMDIVHSICNLLDELQPREDVNNYREQIEFVEDRRYAVDASRIANEQERHQANHSPPASAKPPKSTLLTPIESK